VPLVRTYRTGGAAVSAALPVAISASMYGRSFSKSHTGTWRAKSS
jgi:hypothetical protein